MLSDLFKERKGEQLNEQLPYHYFSEEENLFYNSSSIGFGFELSPLSFASDSIAESLNTLLLGLPEGDDFDYHISLRSTSRVNSLVEINRKASAQYGGIYERFANNQAIYTNWASKNGFMSEFGNDAKFDLREYQCCFFVSTKNAKKEDKLAELQESLKIELIQIGMSVIDIKPAYLVNKINDSFNFSVEAIDHPSFEYNPYEEIYKQCLSTDSQYLVHDDSIEYKFTNYDGQKEKARIVTLGLQKLPLEFQLFRLPNCFADIMNVNKSIQCPFELSLSFRIEDKGKVTVQNDSKIKKLSKWENTAIGAFMPNLGKELNERRLLKEGLTKQNCKTAKMFFNLTLFSTDNEYKSHKKAAMNSFQNEGLMLTPNDLSHNASFLGSLPFMNSDGFFDDLEKLKLVRKVKTTNLVNFLPLVTDPYSYGIGLLLPTFRRSLYFFDPFNCGSDNFNIAIGANSGSGKSFLTQAIEKNVLERGGSVWVLDKGESYKKSTKMFNGVFMNHNDITLNPFTHLNKIASGESFIDEDGEMVNPLQAVISDIVNLFVIIASPNKQVEQVHRIAFMKAIENTYKKFGVEAKVDNVRDEMEIIAKEREDKGISDLAYNLNPYCTDGLFPKIFNEPSKLDPNVKLTVLEMDGFNDDLLQSAVYALMVNINQAMYLSGDRSTPKMCIIEEAWKLMAGDNAIAANFIEEGYRTARKFRGSFCSVTQGIKDYFRSSGSEAAYNNSDIKIFLRQGDGFDNYTTENPTAFTPYEKMMLKSFPTAKKAGFSSMMLRIGGNASFHRFFADPVTAAMLNTDGIEYQMVETLEKSGLSTEQAIMKTAEHFHKEDLNKFNNIISDWNKKIDRLKERGV